MIIIGAGIAGAMAAHFFSSSCPTVYEARQTAESEHKAIMRFRDVSMGYLLGTPMEKVHVTKAIYYQGRFSSPTPEVLNLYSRKVAHGIFNRSIQMDAPVDRYIAREPVKIQNVKYGYKLDGIEQGICHFGTLGGIEYDVAISTIPLPAMALLANIKIPDSKVVSYPIYVIRADLELPSTVYQTVYFPGSDTPIYRISLERNVLVIESQSRHPNKDELADAIKIFGIYPMDLGRQTLSTQKHGKMVDMDEDLRKLVINQLTEKYGIYSLGRYATWRNITSDVLIDDLEKIAKMMKFSPVAQKYAMMLERSE